MAKDGERIEGRGGNQADRVIGAHQYIKALRGGMSGSVLARRIGVTSSAVSQWENGKRSPTSGQLARIFEACNTPPAEVISILNELGIDANNQDTERAYLEAVSTQLNALRDAHRSALVATDSIHSLVMGRLLRLSSPSSDSN